MTESSPDTLPKPKKRRMGRKPQVGMGRATTRQNRLIIPNPYMRRPLPWLIAANQLREHPLEQDALCNYGGHSHANVRVCYLRLRERGLLRPDNSIDFDSKVWKSFSPKPTPLEDLAISLARPEAAPRAATKEERKDPDRDLESLSPERAIKLLTSWVESGAAGKDAPKFISQIMDLRRLVGRVTGPPAPLTEDAQVERLTALLDSLAPEVIHRSMQALHDIQAARKTLTSEAEASPSPPDQSQGPSGDLGLPDPNHPPESSERSPA